MHPLLILKVLLLLTAANGTPLIAKDFLGDHLAIPIDGGANFVDGRPILGASKTVRGILLSVLVTTAFALLVGLGWKIGLLVAMMAMFGDLFSSFLKRRLNFLAGSRATGLDQIPESLFPLLACRSALPLTASDILAAAAMFFVGEVLFSLLFYHYHLRDRPY
jgi:CDP-diglyceride synthetase